MKSCHRILLASILIFSFSSMFAQAPPKREFRGAWVATVTNIDWPSSSGISPQAQRNQLLSLFDLLSGAGCNAVIFQVRPACDAFYASPYEPWSSWLTGSQGSPPSDSYDPLQFAVQEAHRRGMELHAWFNPYRVKLSSTSPTLAVTNIAKMHPTWAITCPDGYMFLDPGLSEVRNHVAKVISDVTRRYDIDGVHMDDYFYPYSEHSFTKEDSATFRLYHRAFAYPDSLAPWRRDNVNLLIKQVYDSVQAIRPSVKVGMSPFGLWKNGVPSGTGGTSAYDVLYCDAVAWLTGKYIDYIAPQLYWVIGGGQDFALLMPWWSSVSNGRHLYTGLSASLGSTQIGNQINLNRSSRLPQGNIIFSANSIAGNSGGMADLLTTNLYHSGAIIPAMSWKDPIPPNAPQSVRSAFNTSTNLFELQWNPPIPAVDGDTAAKYVVYRFRSQTIQAADFEDSRNILGLTGQTTFVPSARIDTPGVHYSFAVTALDRNNNESGVNLNSFSFDVPITAPVLTLPANNEQNFQQGDWLSWIAPTNSLIHQLQVSTTPDFSSASLIRNMSTTITSVYMTGLSANSTYYWRVMSGNQSQASNYSQARSFRTGWPAPPTLLAPVGIANVSRTPTFVWKKSGGTSYRARVTNWVTRAVAIDTTVFDTTFTSSRILDAYTNYHWVVSASNDYGASDWSSEVAFRTEVATLVERDGSMPTEFALSQNYPNPFNPATNLEFRIPVSGFVRLSIYDVLGRELAVLVNGELRPGIYTVRWDASAVPSGVYFYRLVTSEGSQTRRMTLVK